MSSKTANAPTFHDLTVAQMTSLSQVIGHLTALVESGSDHAEREAKLVRDLVESFDMDHLRHVTKACWTEEAS